MKSIYGPVRSWRLGLAMGVDPICRQPKVCNYKCVYCRLGQGGIMVTERARFVDEQQVAEEAEELLHDNKVDAVEVRGTGEPFLAKNLPEIIKVLRGLTSVPIGVVTNGSLLARPDVKRELALFDTIIIKLDAADGGCMDQMNHPHSSVIFEKYLDAIRSAGRSRPIRLQITFVRKNLDQAERLADLCEEIGPEMVLITTPNRLGNYDIPKKELLEIAQLFHACRMRTIFDEA